MSRRWLLPVLTMCLLPTLAPAADGPAFRLEDVIERVMRENPNLPLADIDVERARLERPRIESQLGWTLNANSGVSQQFAFTGEPTQQFNAGAGLERRLDSGATVGLSTRYTWEDNPFFDSPAFDVPNPSNTVNIGVDYRQPLWRGADNPAYEQGLRSAEAGEEVAEANRRERRDAFADQAINLFHNAALTRARMENNRQAVKRSRRLKEYVDYNAGIGLAEDQDVLQADAQLRGQEAEYSALKVAWEQQRIALNRLMDRDWEAAIDPRPRTDFGVDEGLDAILADVETHDPALRRLRARVEIAEATVERKRDQREDKLDLVVSIGGRNRSGTTAVGDDLNQQDYSGLLQVEYQNSLDERGFDAELHQAQLDRQGALQETAARRQALRFDVASLVAEIREARAALTDYRARLESERAKYEEARQLYRTGRIDTRTLIQNEGELRAAELAVDRQAIELASRHATLARLRGRYTALGETTRTGDDDT